jgi:hypothetical protein
MPWQVKGIIAFIYQGGDPIFLHDEAGSNQISYRQPNKINELPTS